MNQPIPKLNQGRPMELSDFDPRPAKRSRTRGGLNEWRLVVPRDGEGENMQYQGARLEAEWIGGNMVDVNTIEPGVAESEDMELGDDDEPSSEHWESRAGRPPGGEAARRARAWIACDLLLARLFKYHPDHALAHLKGIEPRVADLDVPIVPEAGLAKDLNEETAGQLRGTPDISLILQKVANFYRQSVEELCSHKRTIAIAEARHVAMYLARTMTQHPLTVIGARMGARDHTTVHHSIRKIERLVTAKANVKAEIETIASQVRAALRPKAQPTANMSDGTGR
jgi:hypothetical protein